MENYMLIPTEEAILRHLAPSPLSFSELRDDLETAPGILETLLVEMWMRGKIERRESDRIEGNGWLYCLPGYREQPPADFSFVRVARDYGQRIYSGGIDL